MQDQIRTDILRLKEANERLLQQIQENERSIQSLERMLSDEPMPILPLPLLYETDVFGSGDPPVPGAIPARTCRDINGDIHILLCRTYVGDGWIYTPVADGWITITHESNQM